MLQAHIYWDRQQYSRVQQAFQQSAEFCSEHETWRLNLAHTLFMQGAQCMRAPALPSCVLADPCSQVVASASTAATCC